MKLLAGIGRIEAALCVLGFVVMAAALVMDVGARLALGHGIVGAPQFGLVGMLVTALFGVGLAADAGDHFRPRVLDGFIPMGWERNMARVGHLLTAAFFALMAGLAAVVAAESHQLEDVTSLLRWPVWLLQSLIVLAFAFNMVRHLLFAWRLELSPSMPRNQPGGGANR